MFSVVIDSMKLFFSGRLFQDYNMVMRNFIFGAICGVAVMIAVYLLIHNTMIAAICGGAVAGLLQPYLFKNLKYK